jgi:hypothetical protein
MRKTPREVIQTKHRKSEKCLPYSDFRRKEWKQTLFSYTCGNIKIIISSPRLTGLSVDV